MLRELSTVELITLCVSCASLIISIYVGIKSWWKIRKLKYNVNHANNLQEDIQNIENAISISSEIHDISVKFIGRTSLRGIKIQDDTQKLSQLLYNLTSLKISFESSTNDIVDEIEKLVSKLQETVFQEEIDFTKLKTCSSNLCERTRRINELLVKTKRTNSNDYSGITFG